MVAEPENLVLKKLAALRDDFASLRTEMQLGFSQLHEKVGTLAGSIVGIKRDINMLQRDVSGLKENVAILVVAVDEHTHRLDRIEKRLGLIDAE